MIKPRSSFVDTDIIRLHYLEWDPAQLARMRPDAGEEQEQDWDSDNIPLVMLHGLGATADTWLLLAEELCTQHQQHPVIAFDLRGHGLSEQPEAGYDLMNIAEDVVHGMAVLGLGQVALVGHGWGARVALVLAARHPALISHLILIDCPHVEPRYWPDMTRESFIRGRFDESRTMPWPDFVHEMRAEMEGFWTPDVEAIVRTYVYEHENGYVEERLGPQQQQQIRASLWEDRALSYYGKLTCPVLLVPAAAQPMPGEEPPERLEMATEFAAAKGYMAAQVARAITRCSVLWMPDTTHYIQLQRPDVLARSIIDFVVDLS
ncbi:alpha/beta fold hydrolase [Ktedonospora formicarum]|uniref:AB hydrolase-1 domain-containing protein n=1 Tax=Ktedonospora formicarum TaxID=2778364 RepID=A0A8J3I006_9CHLR|nr:alpha/beta hydrolase [Ktedonospora formicarum]GHO44123.1 hypothetical protein KSX_22860 [Ktedonospora formicarum]